MTRAFPFSAAAVLVAALLLGAVSAPRPAVAGDGSGPVVALELLPGWRRADGRHQAGLRIALAPGWKTYWRAPGDGGIPPLLSITGGANAADVTASWPTPVVFRTNGLRSVGYLSSVIVPLTVAPQDPGADIALEGNLQIGVCRDVCIPVEIDFGGALPARTTRPDAEIAAALADRPFAPEDVGLRDLRCEVRPSDGGLALTAQMRMPSAGGPEEAVVEVADPDVWVAEPRTTRQGDTLKIATQIEHMGGGTVALDRSALRITVLGTGFAVDIRGCPAG